MKQLLIAACFFAAPYLIANELPLEAFIKHGDYLDLTISPDGKHLLARVRSDGKVFLLFLDTETMSIVSGLRPPNDDAVHSAQWINNHRVVYEVAEKRNSLDTPVSTGELFASNIDGSKREILFGYRAGDARTGSRISKKKDTLASQEVLSILEGDDENILIIEYPWSEEGRYLFDNRKKHSHISKLNVYSGRKKKLETLPHPGADALATKDGKINFISWTDKENNRHSAYRKHEDDPWQDVDVAFDFDSTLHPFALNEDSTKVYMSGRAGENRLTTIYEIDLATGQREALFNGMTTDLETWISDSETQEPVVAISYPDKTKYHYSKSTSQTQKFHKMLTKAFEGQKVVITSNNREGNLLVLHVSSDINPGEYYLFDTKTKGARFLWANMSWFDPRQMQTKEPISLETKDGVKLNGYITLPKSQAEPTKHPLVVMVHGGPHQFGTRDYWEFDTEVQLLANRGYAVLQINFRGSHGYGTPFRNMGHKEWGGKMIDDIVEATQWSVDQGIADPERVCIYGASYGGYAALMASVRAPDMYKCTIGYVGPYDLHSMYTESDVANAWGGLAYLEDVLGSDKKLIDDFSPVNHADKIKAAVMLIQGEKDQRVPESNAIKMRDELKKVGAEPIYLSFGRSGHGVWNEESRNTLYTEMLKFLGTHIGQE